MMLPNGIKREKQGKAIEGTERTERKEEQKQLTERT